LRMGAYSAVICVLIGVLTYFIMQRTDVDVTVMRSAGLMYQEQPNGYISNLYNADLINKTDKTQSVKIVATDSSIKIKYVQAPGIIQKETSAKSIFFISMPAANIHQVKTAVTLNVMQQNKVIGTINTTFIGPVN